MTSDPAEANQASAARDRAEIIRDALESEIRPLWLAISAMVRAISRRLRGEQLVRRVEEVLNETVYRALASPESFQPDRPVVPWLMGIARNVMRGGARDAAAKTRREVQGDLDDALFATLSPPEGPASARIDVEQMLSRLSPTARKAIECRFLRELEGQELAEALEAPTPGAARVRVARALQTLRDLFAPDASEVKP